MDGIAVAKSEKGLTATRDTFPSMGSRHRCDAIVRSTLSARADKTAASLASFHDSVSPSRAHSFLHFFLLSILRATVYHSIISTERLFFSHCCANHDRLRPIRVIKIQNFNFVIISIVAKRLDSNSIDRTSIYNPFLSDVLYH